jgi:hypothetical protein
MTRLKFVVGKLAVLMCVAVVCYAQGTEGDTHLGTWMVTVTPPATSGRLAFNALITFAGGGAFIASTQNDHAIPSAGIQQGSWQRGADGQISSTEIYFVYLPTGVAVGTVKVRATYAFSDPDTLTGRGQLLLCDLNFANCNLLPGFATLQGKRVEVEPVGP